MSTDITHSSRKAWNTIRILENDYTKTQTTSLVTADQIAHQLLVNSRGNHYQQCKEAKLPLVTESSSGPNLFMRPFTMTETIIAIKTLKIIRQKISTTSLSNR